jgi:3-oxoacyl-(acyl-carrier-protein) synthase
VFAIEEADLARQWDDPVLARVCGTSSCRGETAASGLARTMQDALDRAGMSASDVDAVFGAAAGLPAFDAAEVEALETVFGEAEPLITSARAAVGEGMGLGGAMSVAAALCAMEEHFVPAAYGEDPPQIDGLRVVAGDPIGMHVRTALVNAADPSGACTSVVLAST